MFDKDGKEVNIPFDTTIEKTDNDNVYIKFENNKYGVIDKDGKTLASASSRALTAKGNKVEISAEVGKAIAEKAKAAGIEKIVFDRNGFVYHGRVKALADGAREGGLKF